MIQRIKQKLTKIQNVALKNLWANAFALLPENILLPIFKSEDLEVR